MAPSLTRGPLPASVYWRRRVVVIGVALTLVLAFGQLLSGGSDGSSRSDGVAQQAAAGTTGAAGPSESPSATKKKKRKSGNEPSQAATTQAPVLAAPDGPCIDTDIAITPVVADAIAGRDVMIQLELRTLLSEACTWRVSSSHVAVTITSGDDDIWSSRQCPAAVPVKDIVVRRTVSTTIDLVWGGKRSDEDCSRLTTWAMAGYYHVAAAALGGEPSDIQFQLESPTPDVITETEPPDPQGGKGSKGSKNDGNAQQNGEGKPDKPDDDASNEPSGAVEPNG